MNANHWVGDDTREFGPEPGEDLCPSCGAGEDESCTGDCECTFCDKAREREPDGESFRGGEAAAYEREQMEVARGLK